MVHVLLIYFLVVCLFCIRLREPDPSVPLIFRQSTENYSFCHHMFEVLLKAEKQRPMRLPQFHQRLDTLAPVHPVRKGFNFTWEENFRLVTSLGHEWCPIARDNYGCLGDRYAAKLSVTQPFNIKYGLHNLPAGSRLLAVGNSHLMELLLAPICAMGSKGFGYRFKDTHLVFGTKDRVDLPATISEVDAGGGILCLLLINDHEFASLSSSSLHTIKALRSMNFVPTHIILGPINLGKESMGTRHNNYLAAFPASKVVIRESHLLPLDCQSDF